MKFLKEILNRFYLTERTRFCDGQSSKGNNSRSINARVMVFALCTSSIDIYMKLHEDSLNGFQVLERVGFCDRVQGKSLNKYKCKSYGSCAVYVVYC